LEVKIAAAKIPKYGVTESGDTLELIERPNGGMSVVLVDGQRSGEAAKVISNIVARKTISLLGEGVRDGAAARAAHDYLVTHRRRQVSAELQILSIDLNTRTLVVSRNTHCPAYVLHGDRLDVLDEASIRIGLYANTKPVIREIDLLPDTYVLLSTDGLLGAGARRGQRLDVASLLREVASNRPDAEALAGAVLRRALELDDERPNDDISVVVVSLRQTDTDPRIRTLSATFSA